MDEHFADKIKHLDDFQAYLKEANLRSLGYLVCGRCGVKTDVRHRCYGENGSQQIHELEGKVVCHLCWDRSMQDAVEKAGY